jgi:hypothetical protein
MIRHLRAINRGYRPSDEEYLEAVDLIEPPLLSENLHAELNRQLNPAVERRGRPPGEGVSIEVLLEALERVEHPEVPADFRTHLINRLKSGKRFHSGHQAWAHHVRERTPDRDRMILSLYDQLYEMLAGDPDTVSHEILGEYRVPREVRRTRSETALLLTQTILAERLHIPMPALSTMQKIVGQAPLRKRQPRT